MTAAVEVAKINRVPALSSTVPKAQRSALRRVFRKIAVTALGTLTILVGMIMLITPGPGMLTILGGVSILGTEYPWARRLTYFIVTRAKRLWSWLKTKMSKYRSSKK